MVEITTMHNLKKTIAFSSHSSRVNFLSILCFLIPSSPHPCLSVPVSLSLLTSLNLFFLLCNTVIKIPTLQGYVMDA